MTIHIDGQDYTFSRPISVENFIKQEGLSPNALLATVNDKAVDLDYVIQDDATIKTITRRDELGKKVYNHTASHVLAQAVKSIFPTVKLATGPAIDGGFYYDFDFKTQPDVEDLERIEAEMMRIIKADLPMKREEVSREEAVKIMLGFQETYKLELISEISKDEVISLYRQGDFVDLCQGPHLKSTGLIKGVKLISMTGVYWRGNKRNKMLTRIYGVTID